MEIREILSGAKKLGLRKVGLTGGEPLVKRGIVELAAKIRAVPGVHHLAMTTNGTLLPALAAPLRRAGLDSLNVSLDTLDPERYRRITRRGDIAEVLAGIRAALDQGFPLKINMVVLEDTAGQEIERMRAFCQERGAHLQLINHFALNRLKQEQYLFDRPPKCKHCNKIRLLADGQLKPCLHSNLEIPLDPADAEGSLRRTILAKPASGLACTNRSMAQIGG